jgi:hypothetical protein
MSSQTTKTTSPTLPNVTIQRSLRPALPLILGCKEYQEEALILERIDTVLRASKLEELFVQLSLEQQIKENKAAGKATNQLQLTKHAQKSEQALRCNILRSILGESFRGMSKRLAQCQLFRWFCHLEELERVLIPSKSTLQAYEQWLPEEIMREVQESLTLALSEEKRAQEIGLERAILVEMAYVDTTCLEANIHFPVDWILMRDAIRSLMKSILTIRRHGLKKRMPNPSSFLTEINSLCMAMSASHRKAGSKKKSKAILRLMKTLTGTVRKHGEGYRTLLDQEWEKTDLSRKQAEVILARIDNILKQLPEAIRQAHERIIGERPIDSEEKILSLYQSDLHVISRGKAGAKVEFGNTLFIAEQENGYILSYELFKEYSPGDAQLLMRHCQQLEKVTGHRLRALGGDRQFDSKATARLLKEKNIYNGICPRDPKQLSERIEKEEELRKILKRRAQTEGRIGILKNIFLQQTPKAKGYNNRSLQVTWAVLAHNLWVIARRGKWQKKEEADLRRAKTALAA